MDQYIRMFLVFVFIHRIHSQALQSCQFLVPETNEAGIIIVNLEVKVSEHW